MNAPAPLLPDPDGPPETRERWTALTELEEWLQVPMLVLGAIWAAMVGYELIVGESSLLSTIGVGIWIVFWLEFALRLWLAPDVRRFLKSNWLTVIALVVPAFRLVRVFSALRLLRGLQSLRALRLVRLVGAINRSMRAFQTTLQRRRIGYVGALTLVILLLGAAGMLSFEPASEVEGGFANYGDALWWTAMLLTTIGSQFWPVTTEGRILTLLLSIYSLGVLGYITATLASFFLGRDREDEAGVEAALARIEARLEALSRE